MIIPSVIERRSQHNPNSLQKKFILFFDNKLHIFATIKLLIQLLFLQWSWWSDTSLFCDVIQDQGEKLSVYFVLVQLFLGFLFYFPWGFFYDFEEPLLSFCQFTHLLHPVLYLTALYY